MISGKTLWWRNVRDTNVLWNLWNLTTNFDSTDKRQLHNSQQNVQSLVYWATIQNRTPPQKVQPLLISPTVAKVRNMLHYLYEGSAWRNWINACFLQKQITMFFAAWFHFVSDISPILGPSKFRTCTRYVPISLWQTCVQLSDINTLAETFSVFLVPTWFVSAIFCILPKLQIK